jgi:hypothetical protein
VHPKWPSPLERIPGATSRRPKSAPHRHVELRTDHLIATELVCVRVGAPLFVERGERVTILLVAIAMVLSLRASGEIPARYGTGGKKHYGKADASKGTLERELEPGQMVQLGSGRSVRFVDKFAGRNRINVGVNARRYEFEEITAV